MKLCFVSAYPPNRGNLSEYGAYLSQSLAKQDELNEISILANKNENSPDIESNGKIKVIRCWKNNDIFTPIRILRAVLRESPDIVHFNIHMKNWGEGKLANFIGASTPYVVKLITGKKIIVTLHNIAEAVDLKEIGEKDSVVNSIGIYVATSLILKADMVTTTLKRFESMLEKKYNAHNVVTVYLGTPGKLADEVKTGGNTILSFGYWSNPKNLPFLIETFMELKHEDEKMKLIIAGGSHPYYRNYLDSIKENYETVDGIEFTGYVPENQIKDVFGKSSVVVLPYTTALGTSAVVHLAASYGKPIIITDLPESRDITDEIGLELLLFPKNDKEALKNEIRSLLNDESKQSSIIHKNLKIAEDHSFDNISKTYVKLYDELVGKG